MAAVLILVLLMWQFGVLLPVAGLVVALAVLGAVIGLIVGMGRMLIHAIDNASSEWDMGATVLGITALILVTALYLAQ